jgi:hypothetical protein
MFADLITTAWDLSTPRSWTSAQTQWLLPYVLGWAVITVPAVVAGWLGVFQKAGQSRWAALIPGYNIYVLVVRVAGLSFFWCLLLLVPPINLVAAIVVNVEVARRFGRTEAFGVSMSVFGFILYPWIGFGSAEYHRMTPLASPLPRHLRHSSSRPRNR